MRKETFRKPERMNIKKSRLLKKSAFSSGATENRTRDTRIFSPLLYQLSYGTRFCFPCENVFVSFGIAKVRKKSFPPNFSAKKCEKFYFSRDFI